MKRGTTIAVTSLGLGMAAMFVAHLVAAFQAPATVDRPVPGPTQTVTESATPAPTVTVTVRAKNRVSRSKVRATPNTSPVRPPEGKQGKPNRGDSRDYARSRVAAAQWPCLDKLWQHESGWSATAHNPSSGAHGIPQALPGSKMASHGADWATNPRTQIDWGLSYIRSRYGTPCGAWAAFQRKGWY